MTLSTTTAGPFFVSIPVADVERSKDFFTQLGLEFDERFSGEAAACLRVGEHAFVMLSGRDTFAEYSHVPVGDPSAQALALFSFSVPTREDVDRVSAAALAAGGREADGLEDHGFMVTRSFFDPDGHGWQVMWMNPDAAA